MAKRGYGGRGRAGTPLGPLGGPLTEKAIKETRRRARLIDHDQDPTMQAAFRRQSGQENADLLKKLRRRRKRGLGDTGGSTEKTGRMLTFAELAERLKAQGGLPPAAELRRRAGR